MASNILLLSCCALITTKAVALPFSQNSSFSECYRSEEDELSERELELLAQNRFTTFVYVPEDVSEALLEIEEAIQKEGVDPFTAEFYTYLRDDCQIAPQWLVRGALDSILVEKKCDDNFKEVIDELSRYKHQIDSGEAIIIVDDDQNFIGSKVKIGCRLFVRNSIRTKYLHVYRTIRAKNIHVRKNMVIRGNLTVDGKISGQTDVQGPKKTGTNKLVNGHATISTKHVKSSSRIMLTVQPGTAPKGVIYVSHIHSSKSFTIKSTSPSDTCTVYWQIWESTH